MRFGEIGLDSTTAFFEYFNRPVVLPRVAAGDGEVYQCAGVPFGRNEMDLSRCSIAFAFCPASR